MTNILLVKVPSYASCWILMCVLL